MTAEQNKKLVAHLYSKAANGNNEPMASAFADDMVWTIIGSTPVSGTYDGLEEIRGVLAPKLMSSFETIPRLIIDRLIAEGDHVVVLAHGEGGRTENGTEYNNSYCHVLRLRDGKFVEFLEYCDTDLVMRAGLGQS